MWVCSCILTKVCLNKNEKKLSVLSTSSVPLWHIFDVKLDQAGAWKSKAWEQVALFNEWTELASSKQSQSHPPLINLICQKLFESNNKKNDWRSWKFERAARNWRKRDCLLWHWKEEGWLANRWIVQGSILNNTGTTADIQFSSLLLLFLLLHSTWLLNGVVSMCVERKHS